MSSKNYLDALSAERRHGAMLRNLVFVVAALGGLSTFLAWKVPKSISVHLLPSVTAGSTVQADSGETPVPPYNVYSFAYYIWQQINRWNTDGATDYGQQIFRMQNYITPQCVAQLTGDLQARQKASELRYRTRLVSEVPGFGYASNRVLATSGSGAWTVFLDMQVQETFRGEPVKDVYIRYPLRVVRFDVDRERNPWQLALDCYGTNRPARLDEKELRVDRVRQPNAPLKVPALPSEVVPAALPDAAALDTPATASPQP